MPIISRIGDYNTQDVKGTMESIYMTTLLQTRLDWGQKCAITNYCDLTNSQQCLTQHSVFSGLNACSLLTLTPQCPPTSVRARNVRLPWLVSHMSPQGWRSSGQCVGGPVSGKRRFERTSTQDTQHRAQG